MRVPLLDGRCADALVPPPVSLRAEAYRRLLRRRGRGDCGEEDERNEGEVHGGYGGFVHLNGVVRGAEPSSLQITGSKYMLFS